MRSRGSGSRARAGALLALVLCGSLLLGCGSKGDDAGSAPATTEVAAAEAEAQGAAMDEAEEQMATIRLPGAIGVFSETIQACVPGQYPQATRTDRSSLTPDELQRQLGEQLLADGWTQDEDSNGRQSYAKDPYRLWVEVSVADDGDTKATLELATSEVNCT